MQGFFIGSVNSLPFNISSILCVRSRNLICHPTISHSHFTSSDPALRLVNMASWYVDIVTGRGRCLLAKDAIDKGQIVLEEEPFAMVVSQPYSDVACGFCGKLCINGVVYALNQEDSVKYCSEACITTDYPVHALELDALKLLKNVQLPSINIDSLKLIIRCGCVRASEKSESNSSGDSSGKISFKDVMDLESISSEMTALEQKEFDAVIDKLDKICKIRKLPLNKSEIKSILFSIQCNAHRMIDSSNQHIALGLFPQISMINHSCAPNATHYFVFAAGSRPKMVIRAIANIAAGEEVLYSYVPLYQATASRQAQLLGAYSFKCDCPRCCLTDNPSAEVDKNRLIEYAAGGPEETALGPLRALLEEYSVYSNSGKEEAVDRDIVLSRADAFISTMFALFSPPDSSVHISATHKYMLQCNVVISKLSASLCSPVSCSSASGASEAQLAPTAVDAEQALQSAHIAVLFGLLGLGCIYSHIQVAEFETVQIELLVTQHLLQLSSALQSVGLSRAADITTEIDLSVLSISTDTRIGHAVSLIIGQAVAALTARGHPPPNALVVEWRRLLELCLSFILGDVEKTVPVNQGSVNFYGHLHNEMLSFARQRQVVCRGNDIVSDS